jgi:hypothetical protein
MPGGSLPSETRSVTDMSGDMTACTPNSTIRCY